MAKTPAKQKSKPAAKATEQTTRKLKKPVYQSFRFHKRIKGDKLPGAFKVLRGSLGLVRRNWKVFLGIVLIYGVLNVLLVQGFSAAGDLNQAKSDLDQAFTGNWGELATGLTLFTQLLGSSGNTANPTAGAYQLVLALLVSLALIWALRQMYSGNKIRVRDAFYNGMSQLVQFVMVLIVIGLQLIPMAVGLLVYSAVSGADVAATSAEHILWAGLAFLLSVVSLYMVSSSIFALYIVTLPEMTPLKALRSARQLAANRRWAVMRKVIFLPIVLVAFAAILVVPLVLFATPVAPWVFFLLSMMLLPAVHSYMYALYRSML